MLRQIPLVLFLLTTVSVSAIAPDPSRAQLALWFQEEAAVAEKVPAAQRRAVAASLEIDGSAREASIRAALRQIALRPSYFGSFNLLAAAGFLRDPSERVITPEIEEQRVADRREAGEFLDELYRTHAEGTDEESLLWRSGHAELLVYLGRFEDALRVSREAVQRRPEPYPRLLLAMVEYLNGNQAPLDAITKECPAPPGQPSDYCWRVIRSVAERATLLLSPVPARITSLLNGDATASIPLDEKLMGIYKLEDNAATRRSRGSWPRPIFRSGRGPTRSGWAS
jgi:hypothetical protein